MSTTKNLMAGLLSLFLAEAALAENPIDIHLKPGQKISLISYEVPGGVYFLQGALITLEFGGEVHGFFGNDATHARQFDQKGANVGDAIFQAPADSPATLTVKGMYSRNEPGAKTQSRVGIADRIPEDGGNFNMYFHDERDDVDPNDYSLKLTFTISK